MHISDVIVARSMYYNSQGNSAESCSFNGNATVNIHAPSAADDVQAAVESCSANGAGSQTNGVFTPSMVPSLTPTVRGTVGTPTSSTAPNGEAAAAGSSTSGALPLAIVGSATAFLGLVSVGVMLVV